jgi:hypothetical protein
MAVAVVWDDSRRFRLRRFGRALTTAAGSVFVTVGGVALLPLLLFGATYASKNSSNTTDNQQDLPHVPFRVWLVTLVLSLVLLIWGLRLVRKHRRLVLFLRRFGYREATQAVTSAARSIGSSWRLVTLDDARTAPVGVGTTSRETVRFAEWSTRTARRVVDIGKNVLAIAIPSSLVGAVAVGLMTYATARDQRVQHVIGLFGAASVAGVLFTLFVSVFIGCVLAISLIMPLTVLFIALLPVYFLVSFVLQAVRDADATSTVRIDYPFQVAPETIEVYRRSRRMFSPRMMVLTASTAVWRDVVTALVARATGALVDVSEPTDQVLWEIELLARNPGVRAVFVVHSDRMSQLDQPGRLRELLDGHAVLAYTTDPAGLIRFTRSVRAMLEAPR